MIKKPFINAMLFILAIFFICLGVYQAIEKGPSIGIAVMAAGICLVILTRFEWEKLKVFGLEAQLRSTLNDAERILDSLRKVSLPIAGVAISLASRTGRLDSATGYKELNDLVESISTELKEIGVNDSSIELIKRDWLYFTVYDMALELKKDLRARLQKRLEDSTEIYNNWVNGKPITDMVKHDELFLPIKLAREESMVLSDLSWKKPYQHIPNEVKEFISNSKTLNKEDAEEFWVKNDETWKDMIYFINNHKFRRPEFWFSKH